MKPDDDPAWVAEAVAAAGVPEAGDFPRCDTCVVCDRGPAYEVPVGSMRWLLCSNPGCRALVSTVRTLGELVEIRKAGE